MLRQVVLVAARSDRLRRVIETTPVSRGIVDRYIPGDDIPTAIASATRLRQDGLSISFDHLGEDTHDLAQAQTARDAYLALIAALVETGQAVGNDYSIKLSSVGQALPDGAKIAREHAAEIAQAARDSGGTVTLDMEDSTTTDATLTTVRELRADFPDLGCVLQAALRRTESDARLLAYAGSRVRLCKGAYSEPESVAFPSRRAVDLSYVRCLKVLMNGQGYPMVATHDPRMIDIAGALAVRAERSQGTYEFQLLFGIRPDEQLRLAHIGETVRVYLPYGSQWYGYLMRRMAEKPANLALFLRSLASRS